jgi:hypothetical protein
MAEMVVWPRVLELDTPTEPDYAMILHLLWDALTARVPLVVDEAGRLPTEWRAALQRWPDPAWRDAARRLLDHLDQEGLIVRAAPEAGTGCPAAQAVSAWADDPGGDACVVVPPVCRCGTGLCAAAPRTTPTRYVRAYKDRWWAMPRFEVPRDLPADVVQARYLAPLFRYTRTLRLVDRYVGKQWQEERWRASLRLWIGAWRAATRRTAAVPGPVVRVITFRHAALTDPRVGAFLAELDALAGRPGAVALVALDPDREDHPARLHRRYVVTDQGVWTVDPGLDLITAAAVVGKPAHLLPHRRVWRQVRAEELPDAVWTGQARVWCAGSSRPATLADAG